MIYLNMTQIMGKVGNITEEERKQMEITLKFMHFEVFGLHQKCFSVTTVQAHSRTLKIKRLKSSGERNTGYDGWAVV